MALAKELTQLSLPEIGEAFGGRDHTTVLHACRKIAELRESDPGINRDVNFLLQVLQILTGMQGPKRLAEPVDNSGVQSMICGLVGAS